MTSIKKLIFLCIAVFLFGSLNAQTTPDLSTFEDGKIWTTHNRVVTYNETENSIQFNAQAQDGLIWLKDCDFENGIIELDINPFIIGETGTNPVVADGRMTLISADTKIIL